MKNDWIEYYKNIGLAPDRIEKYNGYIGKLVSQNLPVIFEINHLSLLLGVKIEFLNKVIFSTGSFYREFEIPKKNGGKRKILAPYPSLLLIQNWIYENILKNITLHKCAHAYINKKSIITNSRVHLDQKEVLKLDLKDFFPSINFSRVIFLFSSLGYSNNVSFFLARLCCHNGALPQGAPTSPVLSNIISRKLDNRLFKLAQKFHFRYSRYADDMVFSGEKIPSCFLRYVDTIIEDEGFIINPSKTRLYKGNNKKNNHRD
jgi:RNA-directed DNA polymerase